MNRTKIEWVAGKDGTPGFTWNPIVGCTFGCPWCYARNRVAPRLRHLCERCGDFVPHLHPERLSQPWSKRQGYRIFCGSTCDLFDATLDPEDVAAVIGSIMYAPWHNFMILTKQPSRIALWMQWAIREATRRHYLAFPEGLLAHSLFRHAQPTKAQAHRANQWYLDHCDQSKRGACDTPVEWPLPHLWLGVSITNQRDANIRLPLFFDVDAAVRFASVEPLLGRIDLHAWERKLDWVIVGAQTGPGAAKPDPGWVKEIIDGCRWAQIPVFVQANLGWPEVIREYPEE